MSAHNVMYDIDKAGGIDGMKMSFGDSKDVELGFDGTSLILEALADDTLIEIGDAATVQKSFDVKIYGDDASGASYLYFDASGNSLSTVGIDVKLPDNDKIVLGTGSDVQFQWNGTYLEGGPASGMWAGAPSPADPRYFAYAHEFFDDFMYNAPLDANLKWTEVDDSGTGTNAISDAAGGIGTLVTAGTDNDYHAVSSVAEIFTFAAGKKLWFEARFKIAEATTNESAWWFGLTNTLTTGGFQADALGPLASYDGVLIWKDEATMAINFETSNLTTQKTATAEAVFVTDTWTTVAFYFDGTATTATVTPYYNVAGGTALTAGTAKTLTLAGLEEMHLVMGVKAGPTAAVETLQIDYIKCVQLR